MSGSFDFAHLQVIHHYLFHDVYPLFAGKIREEDISKGNFNFAYTQHILPQAKEIFSKLKDENHLIELDVEIFSLKAALFMGDLNHLHPFREGNGRAQREFLRCLALNTGFKLDWSLVHKDEILLAFIKSVRDEQPLADVIRRCIQQ
ncbi:Fic family protein [Paenibacillus alba]|uniref:Fic/DOC family protein n=1 Tax=Paenibacillus alba TaxID=1197127 RepID=UPI001564BA8F|nr:Fic family protein [Paenibacillus alba]NQX67864.1 Fic family protein [Paenibacillus alba]